MVLGVKHLTSVLDAKISSTKKKFQAAFRFANWRNADTLARVASSLARVRRFRHPRRHRTPSGLPRMLRRHYLPSPPLCYFGLQRRNVIMLKKTTIRENLKKNFIIKSNNSVDKFALCNLIIYYDITVLNCNI